MSICNIVSFQISYAVILSPRKKRITLGTFEINEWADQSYQATVDKQFTHMIVKLLIYSAYQY